jgi:hypothetical protein
VGQNLHVDSALLRPRARLSSARFEALRRRRPRGDGRCSRSCSPRDGAWPRCFASGPGTSFANTRLAPHRSRIASDPEALRRRTCSRDGRDWRKKGLGRPAATVDSARTGTASRARRKSAAIAERKAGAASIARRCYPRSERGSARSEGRYEDRPYGGETLVRRTRTLVRRNAPAIGRAVAATAVAKAATAVADTEAGEAAAMAAAAATAALGRRWIRQPGYGGGYSSPGYGGSMGSGQGGYGGELGLRRSTRLRRQLGPGGLELRSRRRLAVAPRRKAAAAGPARRGFRGPRLVGSLAHRVGRAVARPR